MFSVAVMREMQNKSQIPLPPMKMAKILSTPGEPGEVTGKVVTAHVPGRPNPRMAASQ